MLDCFDILICTGVSNTVIYKYIWAFWQILRVNVKGFERSRLNRVTFLMMIYRSFKYWRLVPIWEESRRDNYCTWDPCQYLNFAKFSVLTSRDGSDAKWNLKIFQSSESTLTRNGYNICSWSTLFARGLLLAFWRILCVNVKAFERSSLNWWTVLIFLFKSFEFWW